MKASNYNSVNPGATWPNENTPDSREVSAISSATSAVGRLIRFFGLERQPRSILRNQTNLPMFFVIALGLSVLCNFTLRENTAEASRPIGTSASIEHLKEQIRVSPEDYELHSLIAELYFREKNYRRAMFHLSESSRLIEKFGE